MGAGTSQRCQRKATCEQAVEEGLEQLISFPTHVKGNILVLILTNCPDKVLDVLETGRLGKSDHCMIIVELNFQPDNQVRGSRRYNWNRANIEQIRRHEQGELGRNPRG